MLVLVQEGYTGQAPGPRGIGLPRTLACEPAGGLWPIHPPVALLIIHHVRVYPSVREGGNVDGRVDVHADLHADVHAEGRAKRPPRPSPWEGLTSHPAAPVFGQFAKFGIVGISNTLVFFAIYTLLFKVFGVWYLAASGIGFTIGAANGFLLNRRWTFGGHVGDALTPVRWAAVQGCGLGLNEALLYLYVGGLGVDKLIGQALAIVVVTTVTFLANRAWTFRGAPGG